jgi:hypothetical protein
MQVAAQRLRTVIQSSRVVLPLNTMVAVRALAFQATDSCVPVPFTGPANTLRAICMLLNRDITQRATCRECTMHGCTLKLKAQSHHTLNSL